MKNYWTNEGLFNEEYNEMLKADFNFTRAEENAMYKYYRYYNDGDLPSGAKYASTFRIQVYLESQANIAVAKAYVRFKKNNVSDLIKSFSKKSFVSFSAFTL